MNSPNLFPQTKPEHNRASTLESIPKHDEELGLLDPNEDSDDDGLPTYQQVKFVRAGYRPIGDPFAVEYHRNITQVGRPLLSDHPL